MIASNKWLKRGKGSTSLCGVKETIDHKLAGRTQIDTIDEWFLIDITWIPWCAHRPLTQAITSIIRFPILLSDKIAPDILWLKWALVLFKYGLSLVLIYFPNHRRTTNTQRRGNDFEKFVFDTHIGSIHSAEQARDVFNFSYLTLIARHACVGERNTSLRIIFFSSLVRVCRLTAAARWHNMTAPEFASQNQHTLVWPFLRVESRV